MKVNFSADIAEASGLVPLLNIILGSFSEAFSNKDFGNNEVELFFVINCLTFPARVRRRYDSKEQVLYWDIILDYKSIKSAHLDAKKRMLAHSIVNSFDFIDKYKRLNLDKVKLQKEAEKYFRDLGWIKVKDKHTT